MDAGKKQNVTRSANESRSLPITENLFNNRAANPSKKSNNAPAQIMIDPVCKSPLKTATTPIQPQVRLHNVRKFGMCFIT